MTQKNETIPLFLALLITASIIGSGLWWFTRKSGLNIGNYPTNEQNNTPEQASTPSPSIAFPPPTNVPSGTTIKIDGSTSMVQINRALRNGFMQQFPGTKVIIEAGGSERGIQDLLAGKVDIAGVSRPLTSEEKSQGLVGIAVTKDAIAIVVGDRNPFRRGLTQEQVVDVFQGKITKWPEIGGNARTIRVINRPLGSGTHQVFREVVLHGANFGTTSNISTMQEDATTPILRALGSDGISYATYEQVANQRTVRTVAIDGLTPEAPNYPYQRTLYYVYKQPANDAVKAFLGYVSSPLGKQTILAK